MNSGTLQAPNDNLTVQGNSTLTLNGGAVPDTTTVNDSTLNLGESSTTGAGTIVVHGNSTLTGNISAGQTVWVQGHGSFGGNATLTVSGGASNAGTINLQSGYQGYDSDLVISGDGTFTNAASGIIEANAGTGGNRNITGNLTNSGAIDVGDNTYITFTGGVYEEAGGTNQASFYVYNAQVQVTASAASGTTIQLVGNTSLLGDNPAGTTLLVQGHGVFGGNGILTVSGGASNAGTILLQSGYQGYDSDLVISGSGSFTNAAGGIIQADPGTGGNRNITGNLTNSGQIVVNNYITFTGGVYEEAGGTNQASFYVYNAQVRVTASAPGGTTIQLVGNTSLLGDNPAGTTLLVQGHGVFGGNGILTVSGGASNAGTILLKSGYQGWDSDLAVSGSGSFTNAAGGIIQADPGTGGNRNITGNLTNSGQIVVNNYITFSGGVYEEAGGTNQASFYVYNAQVLVTASAPSGTTIQLVGSSTLQGDNLPGTTLLVQGHGVFGGNGTLTVSAGATNAGTIILESGYQGYDSNLVVSGGGTFTNGSGGIIEADSGTGGSRTIAGELVNAGTLNVNTNLTLGGTGGTENHVNTGTINFASNATLSVYGNSFTNQDTGMITGSGEIASNFSGGALLYNEGTIQVPAGDTLQLTGQFQNFSSSDQRLTGGTYDVTGTFRFDGASIVTDDANIILTGAGSTGGQIYSTANANDALAGLATITANGSLTIRNGRNFTTAASFDLQQ